MTTDMLPETAWGYTEIEDWMEIGQETCQRINRLTMRDDAVSSAKLAHAVAKVWEKHPAIYQAVIARRAADVARSAAEPMGAGVRRALALAD
ncbi:MAG TPA: hypothetical protein VMY42_18090 [Thermoguttaceae bacterium]|nr:hypothetical protein [Thermoguttaceae bacterium]